MQITQDKTQRNQVTRFGGLVPVHCPLHWQGEVKLPAEERQKRRYRPDATSTHTPTHASHSFTVGFGYNYGMGDNARVFTFLCQMPPNALKTVLSMATARPVSAHGFITATRYRPKHAIWAGKLWGIAYSALPSPSRRETAIGGEQLPPEHISDVGCSKTPNSSWTLWRWRTIITISALFIGGLGTLLACPAHVFSVARALVSCQPAKSGGQATIHEVS
jgi:hypothetical protein